MVKARPLIAEFLGTFVLVFVGILSVVNSGGNLVIPALGFGFIIIGLVAALGSTSGAHFNPAVTLAMLATKRIEVGRALWYIIVQCVGAVLASFAVKLALGATAVSSNVELLKGLFLSDQSGADELTEAIRVGTTSYKGDMGSAFFVESLITFLLVVVIFGTAVKKNSSNLTPVYIGLTISFLIFGTGPLTGAAINPARWFGPALVGGTFDGATLVVYALGPALGGVLGALFSQHVLYDDLEPASTN